MSGQEQPKQGKPKVRILVTEYTKILQEIEDLRTRYNKLANDDKRWERYAILGAATEIYKVNYGTLGMTASVSEARELYAEVKKQEEA